MPRWAHYRKVGWILKSQFFLDIEATFPGDPTTSTSNGESAVISVNPMDFHDVAEPSATSNSSTLAMNAIGLPAPSQIPSILVIALNDPPAQGDPFDSQLQMDDFPATLLHPASSFTLGKTPFLHSSQHFPVQTLQFGPFLQKCAPPASTRPSDV